MPELSISLLGAFAASLKERPLTPFRTKSVQALLIYLVCEAERPHQRDALMDLLWQGMLPTSAQANMRQTVYRLRKLIPEVKGKDGDTVIPFLITNRQTIQVNPDADYFLDVAAFTKSKPTEAIALYRGDFLADFYLPDSESFEEWAANRRADYRWQVLEMMEEETAVHLQQANYDKAIQLARQQLAIDNLRESSHRQLMEALARNGHRQEALSHYNTLRQLLQDELAIEPDAVTVALIETIRAGDLATVAAVETPQIPHIDESRPKHNLPQQLTSFIGREKEIEAVSNLLTQHHLVMLTGVGGIGKTNLSLQVGRILLDSFPDGVWLVELAPLADPNLIPQTAASALSVPDSPNQPVLQTIINYLQEKYCLLILDNCEHLINAAAKFVQSLLQSCPDLKILASSREALNVPGEIPFHVPSLSIPDASQSLALDEWKQYEAMRLFVERATAVLPDFHITLDNITPLMQICRRLDGIPLALELAAARVKMLTLAQIAERLNDRFRLLTGGSRTALPRQQTLRALIDWSWELLTQAEQLLLQRLSVFMGGMDLEAVETVCAGEGLEMHEILDVLSELLNKSLVIAQREQGKRTRYQLLETIRQYAQERLFIAGQGNLFRQRHLDYFLQLGEQAERALVGPDQVAWLNRLEKEWDNIRVALNWAYETDSEKGLRLTAGLVQLWYLRGNISEGEEWLVQLLAHPENVEPAIRAKALDIQGIFNSNLYNLNHSRLLLEESLSLYQSLEDRSGIALCSLHLGWTTNGLDERDIAQNHFANSLTLYRELEDKLGLANALFGIGYLLGNMLNQYEPAAVYLQESLSLYRELEHLEGIADVLTVSGYLALRQGNYDTARLWLEECLAYNELLQGKNAGRLLFITLGELYFRLGAYEKAQRYLEEGILFSKQTGEKSAGYWGQVRLGYCFLGMGKLGQAQAIFNESQKQFKESGSIIGVVFAIEGLAILAVRRQKPERAARLFAWADATREAFQDPRPPTEQADVDRETGIILQMIDGETYAAAYAGGQVMTMEQAIAYALEDGN